MGEGGDKGGRRGGEEGGEKLYTVLCNLRTLCSFLGHSNLITCFNGFPSSLFFMYAKNYFSTS